MPSSLPRDLRVVLGLFAALAATGCATEASQSSTLTAEAAGAETQAALAEGAVATEAVNDHCAKKVPESPFERSEAAYVLPDVTLLDQAGRPFPIQQLAAADEPVAVNFIFATCTTICPVMTATFAKMRDALGDDADRIRMVSITIDPDHDTPAILASYAERFEAPADWRFLTGAPADVEAALRGFDAYNGSKFDHKPVTVLHAPGAQQWVRLDGMGTGTALADEVKALLPAPTLP
jgi:protein SCO1/2